MMRHMISNYIKGKKGTVTIDFVIVSLGLFLIMFFVVEMTLMYFMIQSSQKAAQIGVRLAAVSNPVVVGLPESNALVAGEIFGTSCSSAPTSCEGFDRLTCTGAACEAVAFNRILGRMQNFLGGLEAEHVTISYSYEGLGYAGGPIIPVITVRIAGVPHQTGVLGRLLGATNALGSLPAVSATITGEDLSDNGA